MTLSIFRRLFWPNVLVILVLVCPLSAQAVEKWFQNGAGGGTGTQSDPYLVPSDDPDAFDNTLHGVLASSDDVIVHLTGTFTTYGNIPNYYRGTSYSRLHILGAGRTGTTLKLADWAPGVSWGDGTTHKYVVRYPYSNGGALSTYIRDFKVSRMTIDCNWANNGSWQSMVAGISQHCYVGYIYDVHVKNAGSNVMSTNGAEPEVFPINLSCLAVPNSFSPAVAGRTTPYLLVLSSAMSNCSFRYQGYATAIMLETGANRTAETGLIWSCNVWDIPVGAAYGAGTSSQVRFSGNTCSDVNRAFNWDSTPCANVTIEYNTFSAGNGINIGAPGWGSGSFANILITNNTITTTGPVVCDYAWAIRLDGGNSNVTIQNNNHYPAGNAVKVAIINNEQYGTISYSPADWQAVWKNRCQE